MIKEIEIENQFWTNKIEKRYDFFESIIKKSESYFSQSFTYDETSSLYSLKIKNLTLYFYFISIKDDSYAVLTTSTPIGFNQFNIHQSGKIEEFNQESIKDSQINNLIYSYLSYLSQSLDFSSSL